jgi:hypothetical protein
LDRLRQASKLSFSLDDNDEHRLVEVGLNYGSTVHLFRISEYNFLGHPFASGTRESLSAFNTTVNHSSDNSLASSL